MFKRIRYINNSTISGSNPLRDECGMMWGVDNDNLEAGYVFNNLIEDNFNEDTSNTLLYENTDGGDNYSTSGKIKIFLSDYENVTTASIRPAALPAILPLYKVPIRAYGVGSEFESDSDWQQFITTIYSVGSFEVFNFEESRPYTSLEAKRLEQISETAEYSIMRVNPKYNYHLSSYEAYANKISERFIIDINSLMYARNFKTETDPEAVLTSSYGLNNVIATTLNRHIPESGSLPIEVFSDTYTAVFPPEQAAMGVDDDSCVTWLDTTFKMRYYLGDFVVNNSLSSSAQARADFIMQNTYFGNWAMNEVIGGDGIPERDLLGAKYPYYNEIKMDLPTESKTHYREIIEENLYSEKFLHMLKRTFDGFQNSYAQGSGYTVEDKFDTLDIYAQIQESITAVARLNYSADVLDMFVDSYNNDIGSTIQVGNLNFNVFGPQGFSGSTTQNLTLDAHGYLHDVTSSARFINTEVTLKTMNQFIDSINNTAISSPFQCTGPNDLYTLYETARGNSSGDFGNYSETVAYQIKKFRTIDNSVVQSWWFYNSTSLSEELYFQDSQIKYGHTYRYEIYAYKLVGGFKYSTQDLRITRIIGTTELPHEGGTKTYNCLEFVNPNGYQPMPALYHGEDSTNTEVIPLETTSSFATEAQIYTTESYLADFNLYYEPGLKVVKTKIGEKTCTMLDHPANPSTVMPFQVIDDSKKLGFFVDYAEFSSHNEQGEKFPQILDNYKYLEQYISSYDMLSSSLGGYRYMSESPSKPIELCVYRSTKKPNYLYEIPKYKTINLGDNELYSDIEQITNYIFYDTVETNQKYYYAFSFRNQHAINGAIENMIEAELIDDGGYIYSTFATITQTDLDNESNELNNVSQEFKKLFQVMPAVRQIMFNETDVDPSLTGNDNLSLLEVGDPTLDETIWGQEFKIRLTSKKTGRMIDVNLTFELEEEKY